VDGIQSEKKEGCMLLHEAIIIVDVSSRISSAIGLNFAT